MDVFPSFWKLEDRTVIVVGGAEAAARKLRLLARTAATLHVYTSHANDEIVELASKGRVSLFSHPVFEGQAPEKTAFAIVATEDDGEAEAALTYFRAHRIPVNAVDRTEDCDFLIPSIVDRNPVIIGIATGGAAPILARSLRETLEAILPARLGELAGFAKRFRKAVAATLPDGKQRKAFWETFFDGPIAQSVLDGNSGAAQDKMMSTLNGNAVQAPLTGKITLIELDPSQTDLISLRALRRLQHADLILHAAAIREEALDLARRDADRISWSDPKQARQIANSPSNQGQRVVILTLPGGYPASNIETSYETLRLSPTEAPPSTPALAAAS